MDDKPVEAQVIHIETTGKPVALRNQGIDRVRAVEEELVLESAQIMQDALRFQDWPVGDTDAQEAVFQKWCKEGVEVASRRRALCVAAWRGKKDAPIGLQIALSILTAGVKARAIVDSAPRVLNVKTIEFGAPRTEYPEREVKE